MNNIQERIDIMQAELNILKSLADQQVTTNNWYDLSDEQKEILAEIANNFIYKLILDIDTTSTVYLDEGSIHVTLDVDIRDIVEEALPRDIKNKFKEYLQDEITEQREEQREDC
jgi:hypothetical protein